MENTPIKMPQLVFTTGEAAALLKVSEKTVYRLVQRGKLGAVKYLRHLRITSRSLEAFVSNSEGGAL